MLQNTYRQCTCIFTLLNYIVCRDSFRNTLDISDGRLHRTLLRKREVIPNPVDKRGEHDNHRRIPQANIDTVRHHINSFLRYTSHYCWHRNLERQYLNSGLNLNQLCIISTVKNVCHIMVNPLRNGVITQYLPKNSILVLKSCPLTHAVHATDYRIFLILQMINVTETLKQLKNDIQKELKWHEKHSMIPCTLLVKPPKSACVVFD